jgi:hypothetical protein
MISIPTRTSQPFVGHQQVLKSVGSLAEQYAILFVNQEQLVGKHQ